MRRFLPLIPFLALSACGGEAEQGGTEMTIEAGQFVAADGRGGLCVENDGKAAFVIYGESDANCMAEGEVSEAGDSKLIFVPRGDKACTIGIEVNEDSLTFEKGGANCEFYCGGDATLAGKTVRRSESTEPLIDIAGDSLC